MFKEKYNIFPGQTEEQVKERYIRISNEETELAREKLRKEGKSNLIPIMDEILYNLRFTFPHAYYNK